MENTPPNLPTDTSENDFKNLMNDFADYLKTNQNVKKTRKILAKSPEKSSEEPISIDLNTFSEIYHAHVAPESSTPPSITQEQKAQLVMDEIEKLIQVIESHKTQ